MILEISNEKPLPSPGGVFSYEHPNGRVESVHVAHASSGPTHATDIVNTISAAKLPAVPNATGLTTYSTTYVLDRSPN